MRIGDWDKQGQDRADDRLLGMAILPRHYSTATQGWDLALIRLSTGIRFSDYGGRVGPVCLARRGLYHNTRAIATGWGATREGGQKVVRLQ